VDIKAVAAAKSPISGRIDVSQFDLTTINQTSLIFTYFSAAASAPAPGVMPDKAFAEAFLFAMRSFFLFEYEDNDGVPGFQETNGTNKDVIIGGYDLSSPALKWKPIVINSTVINGPTGPFKVGFVQAETLDEVFLLRFVVAEKPVYVGNVRISPDKVKVDIQIKYYNPLHVRAAWTFGPSNTTAHPNARVGYLAITFSTFAAIAFKNGSAATNGELSVAAGGFVGNFSWSPTADLTVQGATSKRAVVAHATDATRQISGAAIVGYSFKLLFFSFDAPRPDRIFWDPVFGSDINYAVVDTPDTSAPVQTSAPHGSASALVYSLLLLFATLLLF
jgi:hypothetical protein